MTSHQKERSPKQMPKEEAALSSQKRTLSFQARRDLLEQVASHYHEASHAQKSLLLDMLVMLTGYARKSAIQLLNHPPQSHSPLRRPRPPRYGPEVQRALFLAWKAARSICPKRLIPFLPDLVAALERHGRLQLSQESRNQLLTMSPTTAERLLRTQRKPMRSGPSTTRAGSLLKTPDPCSDVPLLG